MTKDEARWPADIQSAPHPAPELLNNAAADPTFSPEVRVMITEAMQRAACGLNPLSWMGL